MDSDYFVPSEPTNVAGRMFVVAMPESFVPLAFCKDRGVAERLAYLVNRHGLS